MKIKKIAVIGGDERFAVCANLLANLLQCLCFYCFRPKIAEKVSILTGYIKPNKHAIYQCSGKEYSRGI